MPETAVYCIELGNSGIAHHLCPRRDDYLTHIYHRNAFERDLAGLQENSDGCYIIADLNDLKIVNDTIGHSAGDELLQSFARLLTDAVGDAGRVYRQGGDEFAVLYSGDAGQLLSRLEEQCGAHNQVCNIPVSYAIGYCELCDKDFLNVADRMMYADKKSKKQQKKIRSKAICTEFGNWIIPKPQSLCSQAGRRP